MVTGAGICAQEKPTAAIDVRQSKSEAFDIKAFASGPIANVQDDMANRLGMGAFVVSGALVDTLDCAGCVHACGF